MKFDELYWHDSVIKKIEINRSNPGKNDTVLFEIDWYDKGLGKLLFENVYWLNMSMNFGIIAAECIDSAFITDKDDNTLNIVYKNLSWLTTEDMNCYVIKTISTGSILKIIAKDFKVFYS